MVLSGGGESKGMRGLGVSPADLERNQFRGTADAQRSGRVAGLSRAVVMAVEPSQDGGGPRVRKLGTIRVRPRAPVRWVRSGHKIGYSITTRKQLTPDGQKPLEKA